MSEAEKGARPRKPRRLRLGELGVIPLALGLVFLPTGEFDDLPPPIHVSVDGSLRVAPPGFTLGELRALHDIGPTQGNLLDVNGGVLVERKYEGYMTVNGVLAGRGLILEDGDRVHVVDGTTRTERTRKEIIPLPRGVEQNPMTHLGTRPGEQVLTVGRRSGQLVSSRFRPTGPLEQPRAVALTFDDGPSPTWTPPVLRVLARMRVRATFFLVGSAAQRYPEIVQRARRLGMSIGNHSLSHRFRVPFGRLSRWTIADEIRAGTRVLEGLGIEPNAFRPPAGSWSDEVVEVAESFGQRTVLWSVDSRDWTGLGAKQITERVLRAARRGSIILLHDGGGDRSATVAALPRIIKGLRRMGLRPVAL